ncbi:hypothetical protein ACOW9W_004149 [Vibrio parahaemolyticus]
MYSITQLSQFRKLVNDVLAAMFQGKRFTKSDLNNLIPEGMNKSANDIIRRLHEIAPVKISHKRANKEEPSYWFVESFDIQAYKRSPNQYHEYLAKQQLEASEKRARASVSAIYNRHGFAAFKGVIPGLYL